MEVPKLVCLSSFSLILCGRGREGERNETGGGGPEMDLEKRRG